jgi:Spy/CpxP family protein refolding chaperone
MMSEHLGLSADQKTKVQAILESERQSIEALRADTGLNQEARRAKMQEIRQSFAGKIREVLTPEQQAKMGEMRGARGPGGAGGQGAGKAPKGGAN